MASWFDANIPFVNHRAQLSSLALRRTSPHLIQLGHQDHFNPVAGVHDPLVAT